MRVGLVVPGFSADATDWCIPALRHLARALAEHDDARLVTLRYPYRRGRYTVEGAAVIALGGADRRGLSTAAIWRDALTTLRDEHRREPFDVLHAFWATESGMLSAIAGRLLRIPTIVSLAGGELISLPEIGYGDQRSAWERLKVRTSLRLAARVTAGSHSLLDRAARHVTRRKLRRAPLGVPLDRFSAGRALGRGLLHVGTLTPVKDHATLLHAFSLVRQQDPTLTLRLVGDGPLRSSLEQLADNLGLKSAVQFVGDVDHAELPSLYRTAGAFVLASRHEAQGMVAIEAAACGLPVGGTRVGVIPELATPDAVSAVGDADALARAMLAALSHRRPPDVANFSLEACTNRFRDLYEELARFRA